MRRRRVLALVAEAYGSGGGIGQFNRHLLDALALREDLDVRALGLYGRTNCGEPDGLEWWAPARGKVSYALRSFREAVTFNPDLIISGLIGFGGLAMSLKILTRSRLWSVTHGWEAWQPGPFGDNWGLRDANMVTAVSRFTRDKLLSWLNRPADLVQLLPNTIDLDRFHPRPRPAELERRYDVAGKKVLLTIGRLAAIDAYKGQDRVIRLMRELNESSGPVHYIIAGDGDDRPRLQKIVAEERAEDLVTFAGFVPDEVVEDLYNLADLFVMPSTGEGFGIVYLEAMACGCPVVAGNKDGSVDALVDGELGRLVDPDDPAELRDAIAASLAEGRSHDARVPGVERFALPAFRARVDELVDRVLPS
ncbi:MAG: glycosyltransferase [Acidobacteria bacterium]|nr:glycosyltransferase [Acidobacteriota bacterium]NIM61496.1 glycosyltransferase [Acidobacteriota bacterium]NIO58128.1 glycosyltransferase [Acidobacteriota bacterium]NIQ29140.1 glycosyltransferase [Acidobacteriota bacterium]NIQ83691.1 glycosyltransferase [Acidobacteriota bacterium]